MTINEACDQIALAYKAMTAAEELAAASQDQEERMAARAKAEQQTEKALALLFNGKIDAYIRQADPMAADMLLAYTLCINWDTVSRSYGRDAKAYLKSLNLEI